MKNVFLAFLFSVLFNQAQSQPELLSTEMPPIGTVMTYKSIYFNPPIDTTIQGVSSIWDFSGLIADSLNDVLEVVIDPQNTPRGSSFPGSNFCIQELYYSDTIFNYYNLSSLSMERIGTTSQAYMNVYSDPETELIFPLSIFTTNQDSSFCTYDSLGSNYSFESIGTGLLKLPSGNYNAIMLRVRKESSSHLTTRYFYHWFDTDNGIRLLTYHNDDPYVVGPHFCTFLHAHTIGIEETELISEFLYSNPVKDNFNFQVTAKLSGQYELTVFNELGQYVYRSENKLAAGLTEKFQLDFQNYSPGFYLFSIVNSETGRTVKSAKLFKH